jgi:hypothetical protein
VADVKLLFLDTGGCNLKQSGAGDIIGPVDGTRHAERTGPPSTGAGEGVTYVKNDDPSTFHFVNDDGDDLDISALGSNGLYTGDGSSGAITISTDTTLTADCHATTMTIDSGKTLFTAGFRVFVQGLCDNNGTISTKGGAGTNGTVGDAGGAGGSGASAGAASTSFDASFAGAAGGAGGTDFGGAGGIGSSASGGTGDNGSGADGGLGGTAGGPGGTPGSGGTQTAMLMRFFTLFFMWWTGSAWTAMNGAAGGGGGGGGGGGFGPGEFGGGAGGGGAGALNMLLIFGCYDGTGGVIDASGGNGGNGVEGAFAGGEYGGGGGGGGGGLLVLFYLKLIALGTVTVAGGTGGTSGGTGSAGNNGSAGTFLQGDLTSGEFV